MTTLLAVALVGVTLPSAAHGELTLKPSVNYPVGDGPSSVAVADLNADGRADITAGNTTGNASVLLGLGGGAFGAPSAFAAGGPSSVAIGDLNGDGVPDLATASVGSFTTSALLGTGSASFGPANALAGPFQPASIEIGDFNGDGRQDLASYGFSIPGVIRVWLGTGFGDFGTPADFTTSNGGNGPNAIAAADLDDDGDLDLAAANNNSDQVSVLLGTGTGSFDPPVTYAAGDGPASVAIADLNLDNVPDLAVTNVSTANLSVLLGTGGGSFAAATNFGTGSGPNDVAVGDLDGDGNPDLVTANRSSDSNNVSVLLGDGSGSFAAPRNFKAHSGLGGSTRSVAVADLNGDGIDDIATANNTSDNSSVLINAPTAEVPLATLIFFSRQGAVSAAQSVTITNNGSAPLRVSGFDFTGSEPGDFLTSDNTCRGPIPPGSGCSVSVRFAAQAQGNRTANLVALTNATSNPVVSLLGTAEGFTDGPTGPTGPTGPSGPQGPAGPALDADAPRFSKLSREAATVPPNRRITAARVDCPKQTCRILSAAASVNVAGRVFGGQTTFPRASFPAGSSRTVSVLVPRNVYRLLRTKRGRVVLSLAASTSDGSRNQGTLRIGVRR